MIKMVVTPEAMDDFIAATPPNRVNIRVGMEAALEAMTPTAKRELAAQLLRSANEAEGHVEEEALLDAYVSELPVTWAINEAHAKAIRKAYPDAEVRVMGEDD